MATATNIYTHVDIRFMIESDMPEVVEIERSAFYLPRDPDWLATTMRRSRMIGMVAKRGQCVLGQMIYRLEEREIALSTFAVHPEYRRHGIGHQMAAKLKGKLGGKRRRIEADISEYNLPAQLFFKAQGFRATETLSGEQPYLTVENCPIAPIGSDKWHADKYRFIYTLEGTDDTPIADPAADDWLLD